VGLPKKLQFLCQTSNGKRGAIARRWMAPHLTRGVHTCLLLAVAARSFPLTWLLRHRPSWRPVIRVSLGCFLAATGVVWYAYRLRTEGFRFPEALPLQLCDLTLWLTLLSALTLNAGVYEVAYFGGLGGSTMALVTPDLWAPFPSYPTVYFFLSHGFVVATLIALAAGRLAVPRPGSV
jgi:uncharacterized membrane protein YwaF